jgi:hypothetical protein
MHDLAQRMIRLEEALAHAEERANRLRNEVDVLNTYMDKVIHAHSHGLDAVIDRLSILEDRIFPSMGPMLVNIQKIVGRFSGWTLNNPLDRRETEA